MSKLMASQKHVRKQLGHVNKPRFVGRLVDGAVLANNPSDIAVAELGR